MLVKDAVFLILESPQSFTDAELRDPYADGQVVRYEVRDGTPRLWSIGDDYED